MPENGRRPEDIGQEKKFKGIGAEKYWYDAVDRIRWYLENNEYPLSSFYLERDFTELFQLIRTEVDHIITYEGYDALPEYSKKFVKAWRDLFIEESGEEAVIEYEKEIGPIYNQLSPFHSEYEHKANLEQYFRRLYLLMKFGIESGPYSFKEREAPWQEIRNELKFPVDSSLKDNDMVRQLAQYIKEDREDDISFNSSLIWATNYLNYLNALKNKSVHLEFRKFIENSDRGPDNSFPNFIKSELLRTGMVSTIYGKNGTGKSHFLSWLITRILIIFPNWDVYTNLPFFWFDHPSLKDLSLPNVFRITSMSEMLYFSAISVLNHRIPVVLIDEMDQVIDSRRWNSKENRTWEKFMNIERHLKIRGPLLIYHNTLLMPKPIREKRVTNFIFLMTRENGIGILRNCDHRQKYMISGFAIPYSTLGTFSFLIDIDMQKLLDNIQTTEIYESAKFIRDHINEFKFDVIKEREEELAEPEEEMNENNQEISPKDQAKEISKRLGKKGKEK
ncbi:MAG: ATP-binding protein [Thermoplasmata archaeon]